MYALQLGDTERKTHQDLSPLIKDHGKGRDTDNFVYTLVVGNFWEPVYRNFV
jgi:hypothetical protein